MRAIIIQEFRQNIPSRLFQRCKEFALRSAHKRECLLDLFPIEEAVDGLLGGETLVQRLAQIGVVFLTHIFSRSGGVCRSVDQVSAARSAKLGSSKKNHECDTVPQDAVDADNAKLSSPSGG